MRKSTGQDADSGHDHRVLAACDHAKSAAEVVKDTSTAEQKAAEAKERALRIAERREAEVASRGRADARELAHETAPRRSRKSRTRKLTASTALRWRTARA